MISITEDHHEHLAEKIIFLKKNINLAKKGSFMNKTILKACSEKIIKGWDLKTKCSVLNTFGITTKDIDESVFLKIDRLKTITK